MYHLNTRAGVLPRSASSHFGFQFGTQILGDFGFRFETQIEVEEAIDKLAGCHSTFHLRIQLYLASLANHHLMSDRQVMSPPSVQIGPFEFLLCFPGKPPAVIR